MARKTNNRPQRKINPTIIGAGKTEKFYFHHLKEIYDLKIQVKPRYFGNEDIFYLRKRVADVVDGGGIAIVVFDVDVSARDANVKEQYDQFKADYSGNPNVVFCESMPSIEYCFLLHYIKCNRHFPSSKSVVDILKKYIRDYDKNESFLKQTKWVEELCSDNKMALAYDRAKTSDEFTQSHTNIWKALDAIGLPR